jgi:hypothetical protein
VAVFGAPWIGFSGVAEIVSRADGAILDVGATSNIVIARATTPDFAARLYEAGAWLVLDWDALTGCLSSQRRTL